jgi:hypothetical protein
MCYLIMVYDDDEWSHKTVIDHERGTVQEIRERPMQPSGGGGCIMAVIGSLILLTFFLL